MRFFILYLLLINAVSFLFMLVDKFKAIKNMWRIPEATLFNLAFLGGSIGSILGMYLAHHKTKHKKFVYGMPAILICQIILLVASYSFFTT